MLEGNDQVFIAHWGNITRAGVTQVMRLLRLSPEIKQQILVLPATVNRHKLSELTLRSITALDHDPQNATITQMLPCPHDIMVSI